MALGDPARETMLGGQKVVPAKLVDAGFAFQYPELEGCLQRVTGEMDATPGRNMMGASTSCPAKLSPSHGG